MNIIKAHILPLAWMLVTIFIAILGIVFAFLHSIGGVVCATLIVIMNTYVIYQFDWEPFWKPLLQTFLAFFGRKK